MLCKSIDWSTGVYMMAILAFNKLIQREALSNWEALRQGGGGGGGGAGGGGGGGGRGVGSLQNFFSKIKRK